MPDPSDPTDTETAAGERCGSRSDDGRQCHGDEGHHGTHWAGASRVWPTPLPAPVREPDEAAAGLVETELARVFSDIDAMGNTSTYRRLAAEFLRSDWLAQYTAKARAEAWDEGWQRCSDWWHACAAGESHRVDAANPYRGGAR